jgi:hypothetical protein
MDTQLVVAIMDRQTSTLILNNFIRCTMLRAQNKISVRIYIAGFSINFTTTGKKLSKDCLNTA